MIQYDPTILINLYFYLSIRLPFVIIINFLIHFFFHFFLIIILFLTLVRNLRHYLNHLLNFIILILSYYNDSEGNHNHPVFLTNYFIFQQLIIILLFHN